MYIALQACILLHAVTLRHQDLVCLCARARGVCVCVCVRVCVDWGVYVFVFICMHERARCVNVCEIEKEGGITYQLDIAARCYFFF